MLSFSVDFLERMGYARQAHGMNVLAIAVSFQPPRKASLPTMKLHLAVLASAALLAFSTAARADNVHNYTLSGVTFGSGIGGTVTGSFSIDYTTGTYTDINVTASGSPGGVADSFTQTTYFSGFINSPGEIGVVDLSDAGYNVTDNNVITLQLGFPTTLGDPPTINTGLNNSNVFYGPHVPGFVGELAITGGSLILTPTPAATPEPSSLVLIGTGVLSLAGAARRKILKA
jgi:hypothetical protein